MDESPGAMVNQLDRQGNTVFAPQELPLASPPNAERSHFQALWAAINCSPRATLSAVLALYLAIACGQAAAKLLWGDELMTLALARLGSLADIWRALVAGADPNPPLSHWLVQLSTDLFGQGALAVRLPAVLCVLVAILSLWAILRRWLPPGYAVVGILAFMATRGFDYAYDARSYGPLMGFSMAALALWLDNADRIGLRRLAGIAAMAVSLALALSSNYYGALGFIPITIGEAVLTVRTRRVRAGVWLALAAAALPLLAYRPLIRHNLAEFSPHAWNHAHFSVVTETYFELVEGVFWPVLGLAVYAAWRQWRRQSASAAASRIQAHEVAALVTLLLSPVLGYLVASASHGMISPRCVIPVCCGFGIAAAVLASHLFGSSARAGVIALGFALLWVVARESACAFVLAQQKAAFFAIRDDLAAEPATQPILVGDSLIVLPLAHYSNPGVASRIVFPIDFAAIHTWEPDDSGEQNLWAGRKGIFPIQIVAYSPPTTANLIVVARPAGWLAHRLAGDGFHLVESRPDPAWNQLGGIFTPLSHEDTRLLAAHRP